MYEKIIKIDNLPRLDMDEVKNFENKVGFKIPKDFLDCLSYQNGAFLKFTLGNLEKDFWIKNIPGINSDKNNALMHSNYYINEWSLPKDILLIYGEGNWWVVFDYRNLNNDNTPKISLLDSEMNKDEVIANSFTELLSSLEEIKGV